jgi:hypothetical protein
MAGPADLLPNEANAASAFYKTNPIRNARPESAPKSVAGSADETPNEATGDTLKKAGNRLLARAAQKPGRVFGAIYRAAARERSPNSVVQPAARRVIVRVNHRRHCGTAGAHGGVDSRANVAPDRPYFFGARVNRVPGTPR